MDLEGALPLRRTGHPVTRSRRRLAARFLLVEAVVTMLLAAIFAGTSYAAWVEHDANASNQVTTGYWLEIALSPASGGTSTTITITGAGFAPDSTLTVTYGGTATSWVGGSKTSTSTGTIPTSSRIHAGTGTGGNYTVKVTDTAGNSASATFDQT